MGKNRKPFKKQAWRTQKRSRKTVSSDEACSRRTRRNQPNPQHGLTTRLSLREDQVGITEFVSKSAGFTGVVKSRFSDFHVNEIDRHGQVLQLDDLSVPKPAEETLSEDEVAAAREQLANVITADVWEKIAALAAMKAKDETAQPIEINATNLDKEQRTQIHKVLKQLYGSKLVSSTVNQPNHSTEQKLVKIMKPKGNPGENRKSWPFPGDYVHFLVYKENMETSEAASRLASRMGLRPSCVNYCGTKDKRAKTTQKFCIKRRTPSHILSAAQMSKIRIGNFEFSNEVLKLGDLKGNRFRIALRHVDGNEPEIEQALENLRDNGFINYFGLQRFGNHPDVPTYAIGVALLKSDYKTAAELILKPRTNDVGFMDKIRNKWWSERDSAAAATMFVSGEFVEKKLLDGLAKYGENDYSTALRKIPRNMLLLYPHAFQSLVFNRIASRRIQKYGLTLIPGDLVYVNKEDEDEDIAEKTILECSNEDGEGDGDISDKTIDSADIEPNTETVAGSIYKRKVRPLSTEDITSDNYTLFDVVLPLPGYDITYPNNEVGNWYEEILQEHGLSSEKLRHNVKTFAMAGAYRKLLIHPSELTWTFRKYSSAEETLIASDWDNVSGKKESIEKTEKDGKYKALLLEFSLPTSCYATMLLRELLKAGTSATHQTNLEYNEMNKCKHSKANDCEGQRNEKVNETTIDTVDDRAGEKRKLENSEAGSIEETDVKKSKLIEQVMNLDK